MYFAQHTQTGENTLAVEDACDALTAAADLGWEDCETALRVWYPHPSAWVPDAAAEFPCTYYGDYTCELTANRPDSLCPFHSGEED